jgi:hypothetical protein
MDIYVMLYHSSALPNDFDSQLLEEVVSPTSSLCTNVKKYKIAEVKTVVVQTSGRRRLSSSDGSCYDPTQDLNLKVNEVRDTSRLEGYSALVESVERSVEQI